MDRISFLVLTAIFLTTNECNAFLRVLRDTESNKAHDKHWGYRNEDKSLLPHDWHRTHPKCVGKQQSPININFYSTGYDANLSAIEIHSQNIDASEKWSIANNGHSVVYTPLNKEYSFEMKPENEKFNLLQLHFHWRGSEHLVNGRKFAAEVHMVHKSAVNEGRFAVLGFFIEQVSDNNQLMDPFVSKLKDVFKYKSSTEIGGIDLNRIIPEKLSNYFRYSGSLTTPGCDEVVEWFVMDGPVFTLSEEQLLDFQTLENSHGYPILMNSRPVQSLNDRLVRRSFYDAKVARSKQFLQSASGYNYAAINRISFNQLYMGLVVIFFALKFI